MGLAIFEWWRLVAGWCPLDLAGWHLQEQQTRSAPSSSRIGSVPMAGTALRSGPAEAVPHVSEISSHPILPRRDCRVPTRLSSPSWPSLTGPLGQRSLPQSFLSCPPGRLCALSKNCQNCRVGGGQFQQSRRAAKLFHCFTLTLALESRILPPPWPSPNNFPS